MVLGGLRISELPFIRLIYPAIARHLRRNTMASGPTPNGAPHTPAKICVYCGSSPGKNPAYVKAAQELGRLMAENNIQLGTLPATSLVSDMNLGYASFGVFN